MEKTAFHRNVFLHIFMIKIIIYSVLKPNVLIKKVKLNV